LANRQHDTVAAMMMFNKLNGYCAARRLAVDDVLHSDPGILRGTPAGG
jgi:hypothetical protein